jgi:hypothetical protein
MKKILFASLVALFGLASAALLAPPRPAGAQVPLSASASATPAAPPALRGNEIPTEPSKPPTPAEWKTARAVALQGLRGECTTVLVREFLRVSCTGNVGVGLVAGDPKDVQLWMRGGWGPDPDTGDWGTPTAVVDVPLRRGQSHLFSFLIVGGGDYVATTGDGGHLVVSWRESDAEPLIERVFPSF